MAQNNTTALVMLAVCLAAGIGAVSQGFAAAPSTTLSTNLESLMASGFEVAPLALVVLAVFAAARRASLV